MTWRKKWEHCWHEVKYCSDQCRMEARNSGVKQEANLGHKTLHNVQLVKLKGGKERIKFVIPESDLHETFSRGFGPGGQKTNKSNNCVILTHKPTGIQVKSHDNRLQ